MFASLTKKRIITACILSLILSLTVVWGYRIEHGRYASLTPVIIPVWLLVFALLLAIYHLFDHISFRKGSPLAVSRLFVILFFVLFILYFVQFLGLYPGMFVFDASWQLTMYEKHIISEHHPVLHTVLLGALIEQFKSPDGNITHGIAAYILIQITVCAFSGSSMLCYIFRKTGNIVAVTVSALYLSLHPTIVLHVLSVTKDSLFLPFLIICSTLSLELLSDPDLFFSSPLRMTGWCLSVLMITIFRNNCIYALPVLILAVILLSAKRKQTLTLCAISIALFMIYKLVFVPAFVTVAVDGNEYLSVPAQQLSAIYNDVSSDLTEADRDFILDMIGEEGLEHYTPKIADYAKEDLNMQYIRSNPQEAFSRYLEIVGKNPGKAFTQALLLSGGFWYPEFDLALYPDGTPGYWVVRCYEPAVIQPKIPAIYNIYSHFDGSYFITGNPVTKLLFAPGTYFYLFLIVFGYAIITKDKPYIGVFSFICVLWLTYLAGPVSLVRYCGYLYALVPLYFTLFPEGNKNGSE